MKFKKGIIGLCSALILLFSSQSMAGIYTDRLTQCIVNNTTQEDEIVFIK